MSENPLQIPANAGKTKTNEYTDTEQSKCRGGGSIVGKKCNKCLLATTQCSAINTAQGRNVFISRQSERQGIVFSRCVALCIYEL